MTPTNLAQIMELYQSMLTDSQLDNVFEVTNAYIKICNLQTEIFCDVESPHYLVRTYFFMMNGRKDGKETNITALANFHGISRAAMLRKLRAWEADGKLSMVKQSKETVIYGTSESLQKMYEYIKRVQLCFSVVRSDVRNDRMSPK